MDEGGGSHSGARLLLLLLQYRRVMSAEWWENVPVEATRTGTLRTWLRPDREGDVCRCLQDAREGEDVSAPSSSEQLLRGALALMA